MARKFSKKSPFADLDQEYKDGIASMTEEEINKRIAEVAKAEHENRENKKKDQDLKNQQALAKQAGAQYADATKMNRLRIAYGYFILESKGKA